MTTTHSREFFEIGIERDTHALATLTLNDKTRQAIESRLESYRIELAEYDRPKGRRSTGAGVTVVTGDMLPGGATWLDDWLDRARPWLALHFAANRQNYNIRLLAGAPLSSLASETRITIIHRNTDKEIHTHVIFPRGVTRKYAIRKIQSW
jgi:hypothetical protein